MAAVTFILVAVGVVLLIPTLVLFAEIAIGAFSRRRTAPAASNSARATVLIPAHNEEAGLENALRAILPQLEKSDSILVVADNCSDSTAEIARKVGVQVIERHDKISRGKGYALAHGLTFLEGNMPDVVVIIDADCVATPGSIQALKCEAFRTQRAVQALYKMRAPQGHERRFAVAEFAWRIKNKLRPLGLSMLGFPCQLMGTGMAFPADTAQASNFSSGNIVEDLELGLRLARQGRAPAFFPDAVVISEFPISEEGEISQRRRWEGGSFSMLLRHGLANALGGIFSANASLAALGFDMMVPPLVLHALALSCYFLVTLACALFLGAGSIGLALLAMCLFMLALVIAWFSEGRDLLPIRNWKQLAPFVLAKLHIHGRRDSGWVRTERKND